MAPAVGLEPTTNRLTADRSTTELRWIVSLREGAEGQVCAGRGGPQVFFMGIYAPGAARVFGHPGLAIRRGGFRIAR
jgi:hypothetical protein